MHGLQYSYVIRWENPHIEYIYPEEEEAKNDISFILCFIFVQNRNLPTQSWRTREKFEVEIILQ